MELEPVSVTQPPQHAPDDAVAQVLALTHKGAYEAARLVGAPVRTAYRWVARSKEAKDAQRLV